MSTYWNDRGAIARRLRVYQEKHPLLAQELETIVVEERAFFERYAEKWGHNDAEDAIASKMDSWWSDIENRCERHRRHLREELLRRINALWTMAEERAKKGEREFSHGAGHVLLVDDPKNGSLDYDAVNNRVRVGFCVRKHGSDWYGEASLDVEVLRSGVIGDKAERRSVRIFRGDLARVSISALDAIEVALVECCTR
jgi:hypothetical protein